MLLPKRAYALIDLDAICENVTSVMNKVGKNVKTMVIVKADAYGHGAVPVSKSLDELGADMFGVATVDEAVQLRKNGINKPILILGYVYPEEYDELLSFDIMQTVFRYENAVALSKKAVEMGKTAKIHIKIDTGMGRIGFQSENESIEKIKKISELPNLEIDGIFTHFACADSKDTSSCNKQKQNFLDFLKEIELSGIKIPVRHMDNSAGIINYDGDFLDMVRSGIMTYGLYPSEEMDKRGFILKPAMQILSSVSFVKRVKKGFTVSYGSTFTAPDDMEIATVSIGYADGYPRSLSNKGRVLINGHFANIIGRVCMDQLMVNVTGMDVHQGDKVTVVGSDGENSISIEEVADSSGSFNYEFCCSIGLRVPRVYIKNGKITEISNYLKKLS